MELLLKRVVVIIITISVAVPSVYLLVAFQSSSQYEKNPVNYIPSSANLAGMIASSYGLFYVFVKNQSVGIITSISVFTIPQLIELEENSSAPASNITANTTLSYYEEYRGISIFKLEGVNATALLLYLAGNETVASSFLNFPEIAQGLSNLTFYIASPQNTLSIIGSDFLVKDSIDAYIDHSNLPKVRNAVFNHSCNVSVYYYPPAQSGLEHASMNMSYNYTEIFLSFRSLNSTTLLSLSTLAVKYGVEIYLHENSVEMIAQRGIWSISSFINGNGGLSQMTGMFPV